MKLIVKPFDPTAPGSFRQRERLIAAYRQVLRSKASDDTEVVFAAQVALEQVIIERIRTEDGSDAQAALDRLSAEEFDTLMDAAMKEGNKQTVPPAKGGS
jgi:hypothetical protein